MLTYYFNRIESLGFEGWKHEERNRKFYMLGREPCLEEVCHHEDRNCIVVVNANGMGVNSPHNYIEDRLAASNAHLQDLNGAWGLGDTELAVLLKILLSFYPAEMATAVCKSLSPILGCGRMHKCGWVGHLKYMISLKFQR